MSSSLCWKSLGHVGIVRNDGPQQERAENRVDADPLGRHRRKQQGDQHPHGHALLRCVGVVAEKANRERPHDDEHDRDVPEGVQNRLHRAADFCLGDSDHKSQQAPGRHVVDRRAADRDDAQRRCLHVSIGENAGQHREGRDRHGDAHEQRKAHERLAGRRVVAETTTSANVTPSRNGTRMLVCEMAIVACAFERINPALSSNPTRNMYRITPICAMMPKYGATSVGRMKC